MKSQFTTKISTQTINIEKDTTLISIITQGWPTKQTLTFNFHKPNISLKFITILLGTKNNNFTFETISNHYAPNTNANYSIRSALFDHSKIDYKGSINIKPKAKKTNSYLAHHTLMLSPTTKADTLPCLEIEADDVKAGHAATIGKIDDDLLFYLQSRGIDKHNAQHLLIKSFLMHDFGIIEDENLKEVLSKEIDNLLNV